MAWKNAGRINDKPAYTCLSTDIKQSGDNGSYLYEFNINTGELKVYRYESDEGWFESGDDIIGAVNISPGQTIGISSSVLPTGASTEATLLSIKSTDGIKKITDALPSGSNIIGYVGIIDKKTKSLQSFTRPDNSTPYSVGDVVGTDPATNIEFANFSLSGKGFIILKAVLIIKSNTPPTGMAGFRLHLYNTAPTAIADNAAFNIIAADRDKYLGYIEFDTPTDFGDTLISQKENLTFEEVMVSTSLYGVLETMAAFTPTAQCVKEIRLMGVDA